MTSSKSKPTILFVNPVSQLRRGFTINRATRNQPLALGILASLTPEYYRIKLIDENFRHFRPYDADLVALTAFTANAPRAYQIAKYYRQKGIPVVMGGIHASLCPEEALNYVDAVVVGEAESVWPQVTSDFENGKLKPRYEVAVHRQVKQPLPRRDLFHPGYIAASVQTSRGCPLNCSFCSVSAFNGRHYRFRPIEEIVEELRNVPQNYVFFVDDNIIGYSSESRERAGLLFEAIIRSGIRKHWISQASINFADDPELVKLAARSGCRMVFIGVESELPKQLHEAGKTLNLHKGVDNYNEVFRKIHRQGIGVIAGYIFGWDSDTPETMNQRVKHIRASKADSFQISVLTPLPGTRLYTEMKRHDRFIYSNYPDDWQRYDFTEMVVKHPHMSSDNFNSYMKKSLAGIYSYRHILRNFFRTWIITRRWITALMLGLNFYHYRRIFYGEGSLIKDDNPSQFLPKTMDMPDLKL